MRKAVGGGSSASSASTDPVPKRAAAPAPKPVSVEERKKQIAQLAEMGVAVPEEYRGDIALAGEWQTLSETKVDTEGLEGAAKSIGVRKRKHDGDEEEDEYMPEPVARQGWGSRMRTYPGAQDEDEDLDALLASTKDMKKTKQSAPSIAKEEPEEQEVEPASVLKTEDEAPDSKSTGTDEDAQVKIEVPGEGSAPAADDKPPAEEGTGPVFQEAQAQGHEKIIFDKAILFRETHHHSYRAFSFCISSSLKFENPEFMARGWVCDALLPCSYFIQRPWGQAKALALKGTVNRIDLRHLGMTNEFFESPLDHFSSMPLLLERHNWINGSSIRDLRGDAYPHHAHAKTNQDLKRYQSRKQKCIR